MKINVIGNHVVSLSLKEVKRKSKSFDLTYEVNFSENGFSVIFDISILSPDRRLVKVKYQSDFRTDQEINDDFRAKPYPYVNGPAISYPFLRSFLATLTLNSGMIPILLPSVNFLAMWEKTQQEKKDQEAVPKE